MTAGGSPRGRWRRLRCAKRRGMAGRRKPVGACSTRPRRRFPPPTAGPAFSTPPAGRASAETIVGHDNPDRFAMLYALLVRLRAQPRGARPKRPCAHPAPRADGEGGPARGLIGRKPAAAALSEGRGEMSRSRSLASRTRPNRLERRQQTSGKRAPPGRPCSTRPSAAPAVISTSTPPRPCSAKARSTPASCSSASSPATRRISPAASSSARR